MSKSQMDAGVFKSRMQVARYAQARETAYGLAIAALEKAGAPNYLVAEARRWRDAEARVKVDHAKAAQRYCPHTVRDRVGRAELCRRCLAELPIGKRKRGR